MVYYSNICKIPMEVIKKRYAGAAIIKDRKNQKWYEMHS